MADSRTDKTNPYYKGPQSDHFDGKQFFNPEGIEPLGFRELLKWQFTEKRSPWPKRADSPHGPVRPDPRLEPSQLRVTMVGHASLLIQFGGLNILTDPVWSERVSPFKRFGPRRVNEPGIRMDDLPPIDVILVTHNHYDHLDLATLDHLHQRHKPTVITPLGNDRIIRKAAPKADIIVTDWDDCTVVTPDLRIHTEPCHHWSARWRNDRRMALWAAFVIETPFGKVYHIGDTGFHGGRNYRAAAAKHGAFRLAILPIGAYEPRWFMEGQHQNPFEAVAGMQLANAAHAVGHHWGTFQLTNEAIDAPTRALAEALAKAGIAPERFRALHPGEAADIPPS